MINGSTAGLARRTSFESSAKYSKATYTPIDLSRISR